MIDKANFYVITGGPGVGKTTLIKELERRGYKCIPEVAREVIREQNTIGGDALPWKDRELYSSLMLQRSVRDFTRLAEEKDIYFFDRGIPDTYGYKMLIHLPIDPELEYAAITYRYNVAVFILPPWTEIYETDDERRQTLQEAIDTYSALRAAYEGLGYRVVDVPLANVAQRADFVLENIGRGL